LEVVLVQVREWEVRLERMEKMEKGNNGGESGHLRSQQDKLIQTFP
jgi:hypothetical protein